MDGARQRRLCKCWGSKSCQSGGGLELAVNIQVCFIWGWSLEGLATLKLLYCSDNLISQINKIPYTISLTRASIEKTLLRLHCKTKDPAGMQCLITAWKAIILRHEPLSLVCFYFDCTVWHAVFPDGCIIEYKACEFNCRRTLGCIWLRVLLANWESN